MSKITDGGDGLVFSGSGTATAPAGSVDLRGYPGLTYAPNQWGEGVRLAHNGTPIESIFDAEIAHAMAHIDEAAERYGVSIADIMDAMRYGMEKKLT